MPSKNIEKKWKLPNSSSVDEERPWWTYLAPNRSVAENRKCPICKLRMCTTKTLGKNERSCGDCSSLHFREIKMEIDGNIVTKGIYVDTETLLNERNYFKQLLEENRQPKKGKP